MTKQQGIGRYLAQGLGLNALVIYVFFLGAILWSGGGPYVVLVIAPIYCFIAGLFGAITAATVWLFELAIHRKLNLWLRGLVGILCPVTIATLIAIGFGFLHDVVGMLGVMIPFLIFIFPAALAAGSRFNPLGFIVTDLVRGLPATGWGRAFPVLATLVLRLSSLIGLAESLLYLACLRSPELTAWKVAEGEFAGAIIAVVYFAITLTASLCLPQRIVLMAIGILANAPLVAFAVAAQQHEGSDRQFVAVLSWVVVSLWIPFLISQLIRSENRRILPVTLLEIRIRHALNYW